MKWAYINLVVFSTPNLFIAFKISGYMYTVIFLTKVCLNKYPICTLTAIKTGRNIK